MDVQNERFYVRFKGRVLGPLTREKTIDLAKRGQITKQHELSPDGIGWQSALEFPFLFSGDRGTTPQSGTKERSNEDHVPDSPKEEWYAHFDERNQGPVDLAGMKKWIASGLVSKETLIWRQGMSEWQPAELIRSEWFGALTSPNTGLQQRQQKPTVVTDPASGGHLSSMMVRMRASVLFLSITGIVIGTVWVIASIAGFFLVATRGGSGAPKVMAIIVSLVNASTAIAWFTGCTFLLQFGSRLSVLLYRTDIGDQERAMQSEVRFWNFTACVVLIWLIVIALLSAALYLLGLSTIPV